MTKFQAIKRFFESEAGRRITLAEINALHQAGEDAFNDVASLCAEALGESLEEGGLCPSTADEVRIRRVKPVRPDASQGNGAMQYATIKQGSEP